MQEKRDASFGRHSGGRNVYGKGERADGRNAYGKGERANRRNALYGKGERAEGKKRAGAQDGDGYRDRKPGLPDRTERTAQADAFRYGSRTEAQVDALLLDRSAAEEDGLLLEGSNAVIEALRADRSVDKVLIQEGAHDNALGTILREVKKQPGIRLEFVQKERLDALSSTGKHQGVIAFAAAYQYASLEDILAKAREKGEAPFIILLDGIEDPHNLGAIVRTANLAGAHGVVIRANRAVGLTATVAKASAGALNYTPVAKVANISTAMEQLKKEGLWFVCADMDGTQMYDLNLTGPIGLVIGNEGKGVSALVKKNCDMTARIPMQGDIDSLNASVAAGVLAYEIVRQRLLAGRG